MEREELFDKFINECEIEPLKFCGQGNPNADILIIGKESTDTSEELIREKIMLCKDKINRDAPRPIDSKNKTWANYQKLLDEVYHRESDYPDKWDFEKLAFTTEMNNIPSKHSHLTKKVKDGIEKRIAFFFSLPIFALVLPVNQLYHFFGVWQQIFKFFKRRPPAF